MGPHFICKHMLHVLLVSLGALYTCRFMISGKVVGAVGGESCSLKDRGPSGVKVELLSPSDDVIASVLTSARGDYSFTNILPGLVLSMFRLN